MAIDYGKFARATSLNLTAQKLFLELGKLMNKTKTFTIAALKYETLGIGDINVHYDCVSIPNMGGYRFPHQPALTSKNLVIGAVGIDEVILGPKVFKSKSEWLLNKPIIEKEVKRWKKNIDKIKFLHIPTHSEKNQFKKYLNVPEEKMYVIPNGVDKKIFKPSKNKTEARKTILGKLFMKDTPYFIHVSEVNWARKNIVRMLEGYEIARKKGIVHNLLIVGKAEKKVYDLADKIPGVYVLGFVKEEYLVELLQGADALILPSLHEGFGLPIIEAMACGTPVITSNVFSPPEVMGDGGLLVDPYNVNDIAEKIEQMSKNKKLQETLSHNALERVKSFDWSYSANKLLELIKQHLNSQSENFDFEESYDVAAYRTITTICEMNNELYHSAVQDLLEFDYSKIILWEKNVGLQDPRYRDFLLPFEKWLNSHS